MILCTMNRNFLKKTHKNASIVKYVTHPKHDFHVSLHQEECRSCFGSYRLLRIHVIILLLRGRSIKIQNNKNVRDPIASEVPSLNCSPSRLPEPGRKWMISRDPLPVLRSQLPSRELLDTGPPPR